MNNQKSIESIKSYLLRKYNFLDEKEIDKILLECLSVDDKVDDKLYLLLRGIVDENNSLKKDLKNKFSSKENQTLAYQLGSLIINFSKRKDIITFIESILDLQNQYNYRVHVSSEKRPNLLDSKESLKKMNKLNNIIKVIKLTGKQIGKIKKVSSLPKNYTQNSSHRNDITDAMKDVQTDGKILQINEGYKQDLTNKEINSKELYDGYELLTEKVLSQDIGLGKLYLNFKLFNDKKNEILNNYALLAARFFDNNDNLILPNDDWPISKVVGSYQYLKVGYIDYPEFNELVLDIKDPNIKRVEIKIIPWKKDLDLYIEKDIKISFLNIGLTDTKLNEFDIFLSNIEQNDKVIVLYTTAPYIGHETLELRPNRLAKEFMLLGYKVVFFSFSRIPEDLISPKEYGTKLYQAFKDDVLNVTRHLNQVKGIEKIFICSSFPDVNALTIINKLKMNSWKVIYEVRDDMEEFNRVGYSKWYTTQLEIAVNQAVDKIITVSPRLGKKMGIMAALDDKKKVKVIQNAAPDKLIDSAKCLRSERILEQRNKSNILGYIGHLTQSWFDWNLIISTAKKYPEISFEIIGHGYPSNLNLPNNIEILGPKSHDEFMEISQRWKAGLIPFISSSLTYGVDPNKIYEYLAVGLAVITADMGSVRECPATFVYTNPEEFEKSIDAIVNFQYDTNILKDIDKYIESARWSNRATSLLEFIGEL